MAAKQLQKHDDLKLASDTSVCKVLQKEGSKTGIPEQVFLSDLVIKINKRGKEQTRVLLVTDQALYNILPDDFSDVKRRIPLNLINGISLSAISSEFVFHVPDEYDYRYKSERKEVICDLVAALYRKKTGSRMMVSQVAEAELEDITVTKDERNNMSRDEIMKRKEQMTVEAHESDNEESKSASQETTSQFDDGGQTEKACLDDFDLLKVIGRGSFGKVMQVRKKSNGRVYAMKILKKDTIVARNQVEHTKAERLILQALQHPFLMGLRFAFQTPTKLYFVLDYLQGGELFFHLKHKRRFSEDEARLIIGEVAMAIGHLHSLDVIYRDLKPENILLDEKGHICLTDFGLSKDLSPENRKAHTFCGTPEYLAPEVIMGIGHTKEVDWWSLGILLYELVVGIPPFYSQNVNEMYSKIQHGVLRFPPFLSDACKAFIVALLHRDPNKRLGTGNSDFNDVKAHSFFAPLDWEKVYKKEITPLYTPFVKSEMDTSNFDAQFTSEPVVDSVNEKKGSALSEADATFSGFTFVPKANKGLH